MHPRKPEFDLSKLRHQLEEILAIVNSSRADLARSSDEGHVLSAQHSASFAETGFESVDVQGRPQVYGKPASVEEAQPDKRDDLYDDALVVVTEFGQASPAILQMWLSIDYRRAITILNRFQAEGLISTKGRVRHKAFSLLRSLEQQT